MQHKQLNRLNRMMSRQSVNRFGDRYSPAIKATREEAPGTSRPAMVRSINRQRHYHVLSRPEHAFLHLALLHPRCIEIHEQRMLHLSPERHPFDGHPAVGRTFAGQKGKGTVRVADQMQQLSMHPRFTITESGQRKYVPAPLVGDLLLLMRPATGTPEHYCVNWSVKSTDADFELPFDADFATSRGEEKAAFRHALEELYYLEYGIRTYRVSGSSLPKILTANLETLYGWRLLECEGVAPEHASRCRDVLFHAFDRQIAPHEAYREELAGAGVSPHLYRRTLGEMVWSRALPADLLHHRIVINAPLVPVQTCPLERFADWFQPL